MISLILQISICGSKRTTIQGCIVIGKYFHILKYNETTKIHIEIPIYRYFDFVEKNDLNIKYRIKNAIVNVNSKITNIFKT